MTNSDIRKLGRDVVATELAPELWAAQHRRYKPGETICPGCMGSPANCPHPCYGDKRYD